MPPASRPTRRSRVPAPRPPYTEIRAVLVIDQRPLQRAAWAEYRAAQRSQEKSARDLHRHEEVDQPAYEKWLHQNFPVLLTTLRRLNDEVAAKDRQIQYVHALAAFTGRSARNLWQEWKENGRPPAQPEPADDDEPKSRRHHPDPDDDFFSEDAGPRDHSIPVDEDRPEPVPHSKTARALYRRLVQHLHPDRGGAWTPARQRLWHEVQQAWAQDDADWLARLEIEWETAHELLTRDSPLSRLRLAITELHAARRDIERKLREYRGTPPWRFTLTAKKHAALRRRLQQEFEEDLKILERHLARLNQTIARWEAPILGRTRPRYMDTDS